MSGECTTGSGNTKECWGTLLGLDSSSQCHDVSLGVLLRIICYPFSIFIKLHCRLCLPHRFFLFYCKDALFFPRCSAVTLNNLLITKSCCDLARAIKMLPICHQEVLVPHLAFKTLYDLLSTYVSSHISNYLVSWNVFPATYHIFLYFFKYIFREILSLFFMLLNLSTQIHSRLPHKNVS